MIIQKPNFPSPKTLDLEVYWLDTGLLLVGEERVSLGREGSIYTASFTDLEEAESAARDMLRVFFSHIRVAISKGEKKEIE